MEHDSERVVRRLVEEFFNDGNYEVADELYAPTFASHAWWHSPVEMASGQQMSEGEESTPDNEKAGLRFWKEHFPDSHWQIEELFTAQNPGDAGGADRLVTLWSNTGTSTDGRTFAIKGVDIYRFEGGKIAEVWSTWDRLGFWQQMGLVPSTADLRAAADASRAVST